MNHETSQPWWKFGHVWLVISGPAVVVVAGFVTLYLAIRTPDPVISDDNMSHRAGASRSPDEAAGSLAPAIQARNHVQTGVPAVAPSAAR